MTPYFHSFSDFLLMGKHGFYVWLSWGLVAACVLGGVAYVRYERKHTLNKIRQSYARKHARLAKHKSDTMANTASH